MTAALTLAAPRRADAYDTWCAVDPIFWIGGHLLDVQVQMPVRYLVTMRSTTLTVVIPQNVPGFVLVDDISAFPMQTSVESRGPRWDGSGPIPVTIIVVVQADIDYEVRVTATPVLSLPSPVAGLTTTLGSVVYGPSTISGTANSRLVLSIALGR